MKKIFLQTCDDLGDLMLMRALELELIGRGASVTYDEGAPADTAVTVAGDNAFGLSKRLTEKGMTVYCIHYDYDELPDGVNAVSRPLSLSRFAELLTRSVSAETRPLREEKELYFSGGVLNCGDSVISLSETELKLFSLLYEKRGQPVSREELKNEIWGIGDSNVLDVYISYLRKKLDLKFDKKFIITVRKKGYMLV